MQTSSIQQAKSKKRKGTTIAFRAGNEKSTIESKNVDVLSQE